MNDILDVDRNLTLKNFVEDTLDFAMNAEIVVVIDDVPVTIPIKRVMQIDASGRKLVCCVIDYQAVMAAWNYMPEKENDLITEKKSVN